MSIRYEPTLVMAHNHVYMRGRVLPASTSYTSPWEAYSIYEKASHGDKLKDSYI